MRITWGQLKCWFLPFPSRSFDSLDPRQDLRISLRSINQMIQIELEQVHIRRNSSLQAQPSKLEMPGMLYLKAFTQVPLQSYGEPKARKRTEGRRLVEYPCNRFKRSSRIGNHHFLSLFLPKLKGILNMWELIFGGLGRGRLPISLAKPEGNSRLSWKWTFI